MSYLILNYFCFVFQLESETQPGKPILLDDKPSGSQLKIKSNLIDFLTAGNIIGEMGLLTKRPRSATVTCETAVQVFVNITLSIEVK